MSPLAIPWSHINFSNFLSEQLTRTSQCLLKKNNKTSGSICSKNSFNAPIMLLKTAWYGFECLEKTWWARNLDWINSSWWSQKLKILLFRVHHLRLAKTCPDSLKQLSRLTALRNCRSMEVRILFLQPRVTRIGKHSFNKYGIMELIIS